MEQLINSLVHLSGYVVPVLAIWATFCLYAARESRQSAVMQIVFFATLVAIAGLTARNVFVNDCNWLNQAASLGAMIVFGVMRKPGEDEFFGTRGSAVTTGY